MKNNVQQVKIDNVQIEATASFIYLGNKLTADYNEEELINMRFNQALEKLNKLKPILINPNVQNFIKKRLIGLIVISTATYGAESWHL